MGLLSLICESFISWIGLLILRSIFVGLHFRWVVSHLLGFIFPAFHFCWDSSLDLIPSGFRLRFIRKVKKFLLENYPSRICEPPIGFMVAHVEIGVADGISRRVGGDPQNCIFLGHVLDDRHTEDDQTQDRALI